jgi:segregation and condensation protein B
MATNPEQLHRIFEAALMVAGRPLTIADLQKLFDESEQPAASDIRDILAVIQKSYDDRGVELREVASGFQFQAKNELSPWISRLWEDRAPHFSRAFLETTALIAYRQPITRAEIEEIRGVAVSTHIIKTLQDREWVRVVGHRDTPGKPALFATTKTFLDHLGLKTLAELPILSDLIDMDEQEERLQVQLELHEAATNTDTVQTTETHEHTEECLHEIDEEHAHEHDEECMHEIEEEHTHSEECVLDDEHEHDDDCSHEEEHEHTEACAHDEIDMEQDEQLSDADEEEISFDDHPKETSNA